MRPGDVYAHTGQRRVVGRRECLELFAAEFLGTIAAEQGTLEIDADFGYHRHADTVLCCGYFDTGNQIFLAIGTQYADGQLRARQNHGLGKVLKHITERRGSISHRVGSMEHNETIVLVVVVDNDVYHVGPKGRIHIG